MKAFWVSLIIMFLVWLAGCSTLASPDQAVSTIPPEITLTVETPSDLVPMAITARPPSIYLGSGTSPAGSVPTPLSKLSQGWQTYTSSDLGVSLEYPADWSVNPEGNHLTFRSPQGQAILLQAISTKANQLVGNNPDCTTLVNSYGLSSKVCVDASTATYSASFTISDNDGTTRRIVLTTQDKRALDVYRGMLDSLRFSK